PPYMRRNVSSLAIGAGLHDLCGVTSDDLVNSKSRQSPAVGNRKNRLVRRSGGTVLLKQSSQQRCRLFPQGADSPLIALAVQANTGVRAKLNVGRPKVCCLLHARSAVVEE